MSADVRRPLISIIVPVFNEAELILDFLCQLRRRAPDAELIVVDGGSTDATRERARGLSDHLLVSERSRALQMNAGARVASGETFWFLHADVEVPAGSLEEIAGALLDPRVVGGFFRVRLPPNRMVYRLTDSFAHYAGKVLRVRCGDHGFFCRREVFGKIGGFPAVELMEDVQFFRALQRFGCVRSLDSPLILSARRYQEIGPTKLTIAYGLIAMLYVLGFPSHVLAAIYQRTCTINKNRAEQSRSTESFDKGGTAVPGCK